MHIFESIDEASTTLKAHSMGFNFPVRRELQTVNDIVRCSVGQNIFRALGIEGHRPSEVYRRWASENFEVLHRQLRHCKTQSDFDDIVVSFSDSFLDFWLKNTARKLVYGPASKIVNLLVKIMNESEKYSLDHIVSFQRIPLDSYTLRPLRNIINQLIEVNYCIRIPKTASMSFVNTKELYDLTQSAIFTLYDRIVGRPPAIYFEYFAWDKNH